MPPDELDYNMSTILPSINFDGHLARVLLLTLVLTLVFTEFGILGELFLAALIATALLVLYTTIQAFRYGYLEGKLKALQSDSS